MAKKRSMRGYVKLPFSLAAGVGAVSSGEFSGIDVSSTVNERTWVSSAVIMVGCHDHTVGEGPATVHAAHSDYSNTEVEEQIEATNSWDQGDLIARERANRKVRAVGILALDDQGEEILNDGRPIRVKLGFMLEEGDTVQFGVFAKGGALTAGLVLDVTGHLNGWKR